MKRLLICLVALIAVFALVMPTYAAELKFGGYYDTKYYHTSNIRDGNDDADDQMDGVKTRMRLYFTAIGSENLKAVVKTEFDSVWGNARLGRQGADGGSRDDSGFEIKNGYIDFNVPDTPLNVKAGIIPAKMGKGVVYNDDTNGVYFGANFDPVKVGFVWSRLNDNTNGGFPWTDVTSSTANNMDDDVDLWAFDVKYAMESMAFGFSAGWVNTESRPSARQDDCEIDQDPASPTYGDVVCPAPVGTNDSDEDVNFFIVNLDYDLSLDTFSLYLSAAQNAGEDKGANAGDGADYEGNMVTVGGAYTATDMITAGFDIYYASGDDNPTKGDNEAYQTLGGISRPSYNMDEVIFPGWFDDETSTAATLPGGGAFNNNTTSTGGFSSGGFVPNNMFAIGLHGDFKPLDQTLINVGGAYLMPVEDVDGDGDGKFNDDDAYGTSFYVRLSQGITDGLKLKAAVGYLLADDGFEKGDNDDDAYRMGLGLFWSW
jgi:hypothetical protein